MLVAALIVSAFPLVAYADDASSPASTSTTTSNPASTSNSTNSTNSTSTPNTTDANKQVDTTNPADSFQSICLNSWMKRVNDIGDKVSYKNFGEKYCACAQTQPLDTDAAVDKAIQVCMSRTLLHDSMDSLEEKIGLNKATDKDIAQYCSDRWSLIYPQMTEQAKQNATAFCECSTPKLVEVLKKSDDLTDKEYYLQIDTIAASCSGQLTPTQAPSKAAN